MASPSPSAPAAPVASSGTPSSASRPDRRRQRSARVTVASALLVVATVAVLAALPTRSPLWLSVACVVSLAAGGSAARFVHSELVECRREAASDRAAQARSYRILFSDRAAEHAEFTAAMADRLRRRDRDVAELEDTVADLMAWEQHVAATAHALPQQQQA